MLKPVVFQVAHPPYNAGETAGVPIQVAERLLANGLAVLPGERLKVALPRPAQGSAPGSNTCAACGVAFTPGPTPHRCAAVQASAAIFGAGFSHQGPGQAGPRRRPQGRRRA